MLKASPIKIEGDTLIEAFPLTHRPARKSKIFIGSKATQSFLITDSYWKPIVDILKKPQKVSTIVNKLDVSETKVKLFILFLIKYKLIFKINKEIIYSSHQKSYAIIENLTLRTAKLALHPVSIFIYISLASFGVFLPISVNGLIPRADNFFWSPILSLSFITYILFSLFMIILHEYAHFLVAKFYGLEGNFTLSNRLNFLVVESQFPNIYSIPKKGRVAIFLAGTLIDLATIGILYILYIFFSHPLIMQLILLEWVAVLWQFLFYMKTDIYFVIKEIVSVENLYTYARQKVKNIGRFRKLNLPLTKKENLIVNIYVVLFLIGSVFGLWRYVTFHLRISLTLLFTSYTNIIAGINSNNLIQFTDGVVVAATEVILFSLLIYAVFKNKILK